MKKIILCLLVCLGATSCANIYIVRKKSISSINAEISRNKDQLYCKRVLVSGWAISGFECTAIYESKDDLICGRIEKSLWIDGGLPFEVADPWDEGYIYRIAKVRIEGTVRHTPILKIEGMPKFYGGEGHMGSWQGSLVDNIITVESEVEILNKKKPNPESCVVAKPTTRLLLNKPVT